LYFFQKQIKVQSVLGPSWNSVSKNTDTHNLLIRYKFPSYNPQLWIYILYSIDLNYLSLLKYSKIYFFITCVCLFVSVIGNFEHRRCLTKLRISTHRLHIETGRYQGIPPHQRLCEQCDSGEVEDEIHFLLCCSKFREELQQLFRTISQSCNNFLQLNPQEKFYWLMTCEDVSVLKELCHFIYKYCR
jgi:hypothetical protein